MTSKQKNEGVVADFLIYTDGNAIVEYDGKSVGGYFLAKLTGKDGAKVKMKLLDVISKVKLLAVNYQVHKVDPIWESVSQLKEAAEKDQSLYAFDDGVKWKVSFMFVRDKEYTVEV